MSATFQLLKELIRRPSITPDDAGCQELIARRLAPLQFKIESMNFENVKNLWARFGTGSPLVVFAGHTDVVPPGPISAWTADPFEPVEQDGYLYGRGAADMKSGLSAMIIAGENFIRANPNFTGSLAFLITSNEEGTDNQYGTKKVVETLTARGEKIDYCIVGEATSEKLLGDQIRIGRRGSLSGKILMYGKQGHVAFPHLAKNTIHLSAQAIHTLANKVWDEGNEFFQPTTFQISNIHSGTGADNVIPGMLEMLINFRFSPASTVESLQKNVAKILEKTELTFDLEWKGVCNSFLTKKGKLISATQKAIGEITNLDPILSTGGGTSDARFIAPTGAEVVELGPINTTVHQVNECTKIADLETLTQIYQRILEKLF